MPTHHVSVALVQLQAHARDIFSETWPDTLERVRDAADAQLVVLPEVTIPGYIFGMEPLDAVQARAALADLQRISDASGCTIVIGIATAGTGPHGVQNSAAVITAHASVRYCGKQFLWHFDHYWFDAATACEPIETPLGRIGILICADGRMPSIARILVDRGAQLLVVVTAWVSSGRDPLSLENVQADLLARVRAWENRTPLVAANKVGAERASVLYCGKSQAIARDGNIIALAAQDHVETVRVTLELGAASAPPRTAPLLLAPVGPRSDPVRCAVSADLTQEQYDVAVWSDVEAIICTHTTAERGALPLAVCGDRWQAAVVTVASLAVVVVFGDALHDPGYLIPARLAGYDLFVWYPQIETAWLLPLARARALELRVYLVVMDKRERCFVVDPSGTVVAGTTESLRMTQFVYAPAVTADTLIVPGTDILTGLRTTTSCGAEHRTSVTPS